MTGTTTSPTAPGRSPRWATGTVEHGGLSRARPRGDPGAEPRGHDGGRVARLQGGHAAGGGGVALPRGGDAHRLPGAPRPPAQHRRRAARRAAARRRPGRRSPPFPPSCASRRRPGPGRPRGRTWRTWPTTWTMPCAASASSMSACPPTSTAAAACAGWENAAETGGLTAALRGAGLRAARDRDALVRQLPAGDAGGGGHRVLL